MREQRGEVGVGRLVEHDKTGVDWHAVRLYRVAVAAQTRLGLEQGNVMRARQQPRRRQPRNPPAHHRDRQPRGRLWGLSGGLR